jgi:hypothetical protein
MFLRFFCLVTLGQGRLHALPPEHPGPVPSTKDVLFGIGQAYDKGQMACVALNAGHLVLEAHRALGYATLQYRIGLLEGETPTWGSGVQYAHGRSPALARNAHNQVVEAHAGVHGEELLCMVGTASSAGVQWEPATRFATGATPSVALDDEGTVVEVHWDQGKGSLCSWLGRLQGAKLTWGDLQTLEPGAKPAVALNAHGAAMLGTVAEGVSWSGATYSHGTDMCILALEARELVRGGHEGS